MKYFYGILCVLGTVLPYSQFIPWILENGLSLQAMVTQIANDRLSAFAWLDGIVTAIVLIGYILWDARKHQIKYAWLPILGSVSIGVSLGLPLYLLLKELKEESDKNSSRTFSNP